MAACLTAWDALAAHAAALADHDLRALFAADPCAPIACTSRPRAGTSTTPSTGSPRRRCGSWSTSPRRAAGGSGSTRCSRGEHVNVTEDRAALHMALRMPEGTALVVDGVDVVAEVHRVLRQMARVRATQVRDGSWRGHTGGAIRNVVNIGIGGSDLGPAMAYDALRAYSRRDMQFRFVSNVDGADLLERAARPRRGRDAVHRLVEDVHDAGDAHQRDVGPRAGCSTRSATKPRSPGISSRCRRTRRRSRSSASTPRTCSSSGTGSAGATRCGRRSGCR